MMIRLAAGPTVPVTGQVVWRLMLAVAVLMPVSPLTAQDATKRENGPGRSSDQAVGEPALAAPASPTGRFSTLPSGEEGRQRTELLAGHLYLFGKSLDQAINDLQHSDLKAFASSYRRMVASYGQLADQVGDASQALGDASNQIELARRSLAHVGASDPAPPNEAAELVTEISQIRTVLIGRLGAFRTRLDGMEGAPRQKLLVQIKGLVQRVEQLDRLHGTLRDGTQPLLPGLAAEGLGEQLDTIAAALAEKDLHALLADPAATRPSRDAAAPADPPQETPTPPVDQMPASESPPSDDRPPADAEPPIASERERALSVDPTSVDPGKPVTVGERADRLARSAAEPRDASFNPRPAEPAPISTESQRIITTLGGSGTLASFDGHGPHDSVAYQAAEPAGVGNGPVWDVEFHGGSATARRAQIDGARLAAVRQRRGFIEAVLIHDGQTSRPIPVEKLVHDYPQYRGRRGIMLARHWLGDVEDRLLGYGGGWQAWLLIDDRVFREWMTIVHHEVMTNRNDWNSVERIEAGVYLQETATACIMKFRLHRIHTRAPEQAPAGTKEPVATPPPATPLDSDA